MTCEATNMVKHWLKAIGCSGYIEQFLDNGYDDLDICKQIGVKDIDAIGVHNPEDRLRLLTGVERLKDLSTSKRPYYFILENLEKPKNNSICFSKPQISAENESCVGVRNDSSSCNWACCTTLSSVSSGTSDYTSNCSHNTVSPETEPLVLSPCTSHDISTKNIVFKEPVKVTTVTSDIRNIGHKMTTTDSVEDMDSDLTELHDDLPASEDKPTQPLQNLRQSFSYTSTNTSITTETLPWRRSLSDNCYMMSAYGPHNRSVPPPLPQCPPPSASCINMSVTLDVDSVTAAPSIENGSGTGCSQQSHSFSKTTGGLTLHPQDFSKCGWPSYGQAPGYRKHKGLSRIFSFPRFTSKKYTYRPARGDLSAHEMTMSDEDRIQLMVMVKEGKLSMQQALNTLKNYEEDKKKGIHRSLRDYLQGDGLKMPVSADKTVKSSPLRFLRSFSFRNSRRKKFLQDLEYYYKEQEERQRSLVERMAKMEICEENTYSRPQCCNSKSCDENAQSMCRGGQMSNTSLSPPISPCDMRGHSYSTCSNLTPVSKKRRGCESYCGPYMEHGSTTYEMKSSTSETSFRGSPQYSLYNSPVRINRQICDDQSGMMCGGYPSPRFCRSESEPMYFDRTYGGRHSYHGGIPSRRHSEVVTFVHHVQPTPVATGYSRTICSKCQRQSVCDNPVMLPPCGGCINCGPSAPCCRHRGVVANVIAEECSPCLSNSSSIEDVNVSPRSVSVKANVHRSENQQFEDSVNNNNTFHQRLGSELSQRSTQVERKIPAGHQQSPVQPWSSGSSCGQSSQQSVSTESEPPIEQYKPKGPVKPTQKVEQTSAWDENDNTERSEVGGTDLQENYAQTSDLVINTTIAQSVQQLCSKLGLQHLLPVFLNNGFETLELFKQLEEPDLCMLGITDATERAKVLTAVTLLPDEQEFVPTYKYKFTEDKDFYSKINPLDITSTQTTQQCVQLNRDQLPVNRSSSYSVKARDSQASPVYGAGIQTRDSGCYMEHLNNSNQSH